MPYQPTGNPVGRPSYGSREKALAAASKLLAAQGFDGMSTKDVCLLAGVKPGSLFHYFPTKEVVAVAAIEGFARRDAAFLKKELAGAIRDTADELGHPRPSDGTTVLPVPQHVLGLPDAIPSGVVDPVERAKVLLNHVEAAVALLQYRPGMNALVRLLADPQVAASPVLRAGVDEWRTALRTQIADTLTGIDARTLTAVMDKTVASACATTILTHTLGKTLLGLNTGPPVA